MAFIALSMLAQLASEAGSKFHGLDPDPNGAFNLHMDMLEEKS